MARKPINKSTRFEVFKRDRFTCQYCGRMAPDVILEVDHIKPVAEGGTNDFLNLITSCRNCNRGKGKKPLTENQALNKQKKALAELAEKREQTEMLFEWKSELLSYTNDQAKNINNYIGTLTGYGVNEKGMEDIKKLLRQFSFPEIMVGIDISFNRYYHGDDRTWEKAFSKIGGVCYNRRKQENGDIQNNSDDVLDGHESG